MHHSTAAKLFLSDAEGNILLLQRSDTHPRYPLSWDPPGGFIEPGEDPAAALVRELDEETGLSIGNLSPDIIYADTIFYENSSDALPKSVVRMYFRAKLNEVKPDVKLSWEHADAAWVTPQECLEKLKDTPFEAVSRYVVEHGLLLEESDAV